MAHFVNLTKDELPDSPAYALGVENHAAFDGGRLEQKIVCLGETFVECEQNDKLISVITVPYSSVLLGTRDWCSFDLKRVFRDCMLVHVHNPFTESGEAAFTLAKNCNLPCVITCDEFAEPSLAWKWGMARCADAIFCTSETRAAELRRSTDSTIILLNSTPSKSFDIVAPIVVQTYDKLALQLESA